MPASTARFSAGHRSLDADRRDDDRRHAAGDVGVDQARFLLGLGFGIGHQQFQAGFLGRGLHADLDGAEELVLLEDDAGDGLLVLRHGAAGQ